MRVGGLCHLKGNDTLPIYNVQPAGRLGVRLLMLITN
jgi:hypothetical protein